MLKGKLDVSASPESSLSSLFSKFYKDYYFLPEKNPGGKFLTNFLRNRPLSFSVMVCKT